MAIESSCDETACAVVEKGTREIASELASSAELHHKTGGIVPEVAARKQAEFILPVIESTIQKTADYFKIPTYEVKDKIDALAVTVGPGLVGSLIVGVEACKALALAWDKPIIPVNHLVGHIYANFLDGGEENGDIDQESTFPRRVRASRLGGTGTRPEEGMSARVQKLFPAVVLIVSGGHTDLVLMKDHGNIEYLGGTVDDAAGEAFDKVARLLNLGMYLGGANLSKVSHEFVGPILPEKLPRSFIHEDNFDFSFSGLKTAVKRLADKNIYPIPAVAKEFEEAVVEVLVEKTLRAVEHTNAKSILLGGGVSANSKLRQDLVEKTNARFGDNKTTVKIPPLRLCTDNAVYIASAAYFNQNYKPLDQIIPNPSLTVKD
jgi:N6-L-threonylcarbamoyladenine synthase